MLFFHLHLVSHNKVEATILFGLFSPSFPSLNLNIKRRHEQAMLSLFPFDWSMPPEIQTTDFIKRRKKIKPNLLHMTNSILSVFYRHQHHQQKICERMKE
jgi:hypothetical protein